MNNKHILDLTLRLSQALDQNYDVSITTFDF